jgi:hypothetical protein
MNKLVFAAVSALIALPALAGEPVSLTEAQMDQVTAGSLTISVAHADGSFTTIDKKQPFAFSISVKVPLDGPVVVEHP